jgi:hypothetical protein
MLAVGFLYLLHARCRPCIVSNIPLLGEATGIPVTVALNVSRHEWGDHVSHQWHRAMIPSQANATLGPLLPPSPASKLRAAACRVLTVLSQGHTTLGPSSGGSGQSCEQITNNYERLLGVYHDALMTPTGAVKRASGSRCASR